MRSVPWILVLAACGSATPAGVARPSPATRDPAVAERAVPDAPHAPAPVGPPPVSLLPLVATDVAVSSAYGDRDASAFFLVDQNPETEWRSRTGDLAGAWIEVRLPANVSVTSIQLTAGAIRHTESGDTFTEDHRIERVRVLRDGSEVGVFPLDPASRQRQALAVTGGGGVYRVEVTGVVPGTLPSRQEVCVSDLRVMGHAPGPQAFVHLPRVTVGALAQPRPAPGSLPREQVAKVHRERIAWLRQAWERLDADFHRLRVDPQRSEREREWQASISQQRRTILQDASSFVALVDEPLTERIWWAAAIPFDWADMRTHQATRRDDLANVVAAFSKVTDWLADPESRCEWARAHARLRILRVFYAAKAEAHTLEVNVFHSIEENAGEIGRLQRFASPLQSFEVTSARAAARLGRMHPPDPTLAPEDWEAALAQSAAAVESCGWTGEVETVRSLR